MNKQSSLKYPGLNLGSHHGEAHDKAETIVFGFWVFLMSDFVLFGLMFATYATMQNPMSYAGGPEPKDLFSLSSAFVQTMLLLTSSLTAGIAALAIRHKHNTARLKLWMLITLALGMAFLFFEIRDFQGMLAQGAGPSRSGFLSAFFGLVSLHGLHVSIGCLWIIVMLVQLHVFGPITIVKTRLLRLGLFWHFLDVIWIGIFSIVYLTGLV